MTLADIRKQAEEKYPHDGHGKSAVELARLLALREGYIQGRLDQAEADAQIAENADPVEVALSGAGYVAAAIREAVVEQ